MSTLSELTSKADYIASKNSHLKSHWRTYQNSLTQAITQLNVQINHAFIYGEEQDLRFTLFNHFIISIHLSDDFYSQELVYRLNMAHGDKQPDFRTFSHATLNEQGWVDSTVDIKDKRAGWSTTSIKYRLFMTACFIRWKPISRFTLRWKNYLPADDPAYLPISPHRFYFR